MAPEEFIWTGQWPDAVAFMDRVGYTVPFLGIPALQLCGGSHGPSLLPRLCVINMFTQQGDHADIGDKVVWYRATRTFSVVRD